MPRRPPAVSTPEEKEATVRRLIVIEIDDAASPRLRKKPEKTLKQLVRTVADELAWGDTTRELQDKDGNTVGTWKVEGTAPAPTV